MPDIKFACLGLSSYICKAHLTNLVMRRVLSNILVFIFMTTASSTVLANSSIRFTVSFSEPQAHYADLSMEIAGFQQDYIDLKMPVWTPGSYLVREYTRNLESFEARDDAGNALDVQKTDKHTWRVFNKGGRATVNYRLYGFEVSVRTNLIDDSHAFLSPAATFLYPDGHLDHPVEVAIVPHASWSAVSTGLEQVDGKPFTYAAPDFDILFDSPIEVGNQDVFTFEAAGVLHEVAMVGGGNYDKDRLIRDFTDIIEESTRIFGTNPNKRYVFIVHHYQSGGGGLEHLNSTVLGATRNGYTNPRIYTSFLGLVAHEYFHLWHVKRLRPIELGPFDYTGENYTTALWIMEGFTSYYDNHILLRTGLVTEAGYLQLLDSDFNAVENRPGNQIQPVAEASFDAWVKYYRPDENSPNATVSYYNKGALLSLLMDAKIIAETKGEKSLDDVLKAAYEHFYVNLGRGFREAELEELIEEVTGVSVSEIFRAAHTVETIDYSSYLRPIGYELADLTHGRAIPDLGIRTNVSDGRVMVTGVVRNGSAWDGGISARDEIIAVNGTRLDAGGRELAHIVQQAAVGDELHVLISRDGIIRELTVALKASAEGVYTVRRYALATAEQQRLGQVWLSGRR